MKKLTLYLFVAIMILAACAPQEPTPEMLLGTWEGDSRTLTFREFNTSDSSDFRIIGSRNQHGIVHIDSENEESIDGAWWLNDKGLLIISVMESVEIVGLGTSTTTGKMYGIDEVTSDTLVIWPVTGGERETETYLRK